MPHTFGQTLVESRRQSGRGSFSNTAHYLTLHLFNVLINTNSTKPSAQTEFYDGLPDTETMHVCIIEYTYITANIALGTCSRAVQPTVDLELLS